nr:11119_t:CDS:10 [Entrophospora candida]
MVNEQPVISTVWNPKHNPQAPAKIGKCDQYITQTKKTDDVNFPFIGSFSPNGSLNLTNDDDDEKGLPRFIFIYMSIIDPTAIVLNETSQKTTVRMTAYDSEYDQVDAQSRKSSNAFIESLFSMNKYALSKNYVYRLEFLRKIRKTQIKTVFAYIGFPSSYDQQSYIESNIQAIPINSPSMYYVTVRIGPRCFYEIVEQEQSTTSIMNILGTIAAYYRVDSMKPWGIIHNGCCGIRRFKEHTEIKLSQFVNLPSTNADSVRISQAVRDLEGFRHFLESNVIDTSIDLKPTK